MLNDKDFLQIIAILKASYNNFEADKVTMNVWYECLKDIDYDTLLIAVKKLVMVNKFRPTIADIREQIADISIPFAEQLTGADAWGQVLKSISTYGMYKEKQALESMSPSVAEMVQRFTYKELCCTPSEQLMATRSQFMKMFDAQSVKTRNNAKLPMDLKENIKMLSEKFEFKQIGGK